MDRQRFEWLVAKAVDSLPDEFRDRLENIDVTVQAFPTLRQMAKARLKHGRILLGLYEGIPRTKRTRGYNMVLPDKITIFQKPIEAKCRSEEEISQEIKEVVRHEIAHHFGIDEETLTRIEHEKLRRNKPQN